MLYIRSYDISIFEVDQIQSNFLELAHTLFLNYFKELYQGYTTEELGVDCPVAEYSPQYLAYIFE